MGARRPLDGLARQRRAPPRPRGVPPGRRLGAPLVGRQRARLQVRRRVPPRRGRRRAADRRAAGADARHEPARNRDRARALPQLREARARRLDLGGLRRPPRGAPARGDGSPDLRADDAEALGVRGLEGDGRVPRARASRRSTTSTASSSGSSTPSARGRAAATGWSSRRFVQRALADEPLEIHGDGEQTRCFCHVSDTIRALAGLDGERRRRARSTTSAPRSASRSTPSPSASSR